MRADLPSGVRLLRLAPVLDLMADHRSVGNSISASKARRLRTAQLKRKLWSACEKEFGGMTTEELREEIRGLSTAVLELRDQLFAASIRVPVFMPRSEESDCKKFRKSSRDGTRSESGDMTCDEDICMNSVTEGHSRDESADCQPDKNGHVEDAVATACEKA